MAVPPFVAVHAGAGYHSKSNSTELKELCSTACREAMRLLEAGHNCEVAVTGAISILENSCLTNAGLGSNLTLTGTVECDASIMESGGGFGAIAATSGVSNPISVALKLLQRSSEGCLPLGRVSPIVLTADGAVAWARQEGLSLCHIDDLITERARSVYMNHKARLDEVTDTPPLNKKRKSIFNDSVCEAPLDTVGAVCVDQKGCVAGGVSSGGISLKFPGRIGQAGMYGCGCWAHSELNKAVATSTSGTGEYIIKTMLARECAIAVLEGELHTALKEKFLESKLLNDVEEKLAGVIVVSLDQEGSIEFTWGHTTESMCIGYWSASQSHHHTPTAFISKLDTVEKIGKTVLTGGISINNHQ